MNSRRFLKNIYVLTSLALVLIFAQPTSADIVTVLFTGFNPDSPSGMDFFKDSIDSNLAADFPNLTQSSQVFAYNERNEAFNFINSQPGGSAVSDRTQLGWQRANSGSHGTAVTCGHDG